MDSVWERIRQRLGWDGPDLAEREAVNGKVTSQERRVARSERVIAEYRDAAKAAGKASDAADKAGEAVIDEVRRADQ